MRKQVEDNLAFKDKRLRARLAGQIALLVDGAIVAAQTRGEKNAARDAKKTAEMLIGRENGP